MMRRSRQIQNISLIAGLALMATACAYPVASSTQGGASSAIYFDAFPPEAAVMVDGQPAGLVSDFDGVGGTLAVAPGTHTVVVTLNGSVVHDKKVYVGRDSALKISR